MKYELTNKTINRLGKTLYQIKALKDFSDVSKGALGGYIESVDNLNQNDDAWVYDNAMVCGNARAYDNARVSGNARVFGNARVYGDAWVYDDARVFDNAEVYGNAAVYGNAMVSGNAMVFNNARIFGNAMVSIGNCTDKVINIINLCQYNITSYNDYIRVGCKVFTKSKWLELLKDKDLFLDECSDKKSQSKLHFYVTSLLQDIL